MKSLSALVIWMLVAAAAAAQTGPAPAVQVRTSLDRTALWVGDRVTYTVELVCAPGIDVLAEDLGRDRMVVDGGEVIHAEASTRDEAGTLVRQVQYTITTFRVDAPAIRTAPLTVRYFSRGRVGAAAQAAPAGQVIIPAAVIAIRSTLPDGQRLPELRDAAALRPAPPYVRLARNAGLIVIVAAVVPLVLLSLNLAGRARHVWAYGRSRWTKRQQRKGLDALRALDPGTPAERRDAYGRLDRALRDHLQLAAGVPAPALTPGEVRRLLEHRAPPGVAEDVESFLLMCERARYAPEPPPDTAWSEVFTRAEQIARHRWR